MAESVAPTAQDVAGLEVVVHPLVLLSVVDHYNRVAKDTRKRVVGVLLGSRSRSKVDISNSFAVPFEEDLNNPNVWFLDHNYLESMYWMFKKVNTNEDIVGFYSSGPKIKENDLKISALFERFAKTQPPVFVIIDVRPGVVGLPTTAYVAVDEIHGEGKEIQRVFKHLSSTIEAEEAEGVGVEHLLRDINDPSTSSLALRIRQKVAGLSGLVTRLTDIKTYLEHVIAGRIPINNQISYNLQNILNLLPNLNVAELSKALLVKTNDMHLVMYVSSLIRSVIALHDLLSNKLKYKDLDDLLDREAGVDPKRQQHKDKDQQQQQPAGGSPKEAASPAAEAKGP